MRLKLTHHVCIVISVNSLKLPKIVIPRYIFHPCKSYDLVICPINIALITKPCQIINWQIDLLLLISFPENEYHNSQ